MSMAGTERVKTQAFALALETLRAESEPLFAILDSARDRRVRQFLLQAGEEHESLYEGVADAELTEVAPYLVRLPRGTDLLELLVRVGWGRSWGVFLTSSVSFKETRRHLRKFLKVEDEGTKEQLYFRFYDPRVLRVFLPACSPEQRAELAGPLGRFFVEGEAGELLRFEGGRSHSLPAEPPAKAAAPLLFRIRPEQMEAFAAAARKDFENRMVVHLRQVLPDECAPLGEQGLRELIRAGLRRTRSYRITAEYDVCRYLHLMLVLGREFDRDPALPWAELLLNQPTQEPSTRMERVYARALELEAERSGEA